MFQGLLLVVSLGITSGSRITSDSEDFMGYLGFITGQSPVRQITTHCTISPTLYYWVWGVGSSKKCIKNHYEGPER